MLSDSLTMMRRFQDGATPTAGRPTVSVQWAQYPNDANSSRLPSAFGWFDPITLGH